jgi:hypothetical protein
MDRWYVIMPGTPVVVSQGSGGPRVETLRGPLQFREPISMDDKTVTFEDGDRTIVVDRKDVALSEANGQGGTVQWGV